MAERSTRQLSVPCPVLCWSSSIRFDASALLIYRAAWAKDTGAPRVTREAAMAKLFATDHAQQVIDKAVQLHGGDGVRHGSTVERLYREIRALRIYEGASDVQRVIIAGGDSSGRILNQLDAYALRCVRPISAGLSIYRLVADSELDGLEIALKGGQMGDVDCFDSIRLGRPGDGP